MAQQSLALLRPSRSQAALAAQINAPLAAKPPGSRRLRVSSKTRQARCYHSFPGCVDAGTKLQQVDSALALGDGATFPSSNQIVIYASAANHAAAARSQAALDATQASQLVSPVVADNAKIASAVQALTPGANSQAAQTAIAAAQDATQVAQQSLALLKPSRSQAALAAQIDAALTSETTWLQTASSVLDNPSSPLLSQLSGLGVDAGTKLQQMEAALSLGAGATFPSSNQIVIYASAANAAAAARSQAAAVQAQTTAAETQFSNQVLALLNQSASSFQSVNSFYQQLEAAAQGDGATITLAQAEQQISTIVANRTSLAAAAQAINAADTRRQHRSRRSGSRLQCQPSKRQRPRHLPQPGQQRHRRLHLPRMSRRQRHRQRRRHRGQADLPGRLQSAAGPHRPAAVSIQFLDSRYRLHIPLDR